MSDPEALRKLAAWYRQFAERAGNPAIWEMRLGTAEWLEAEAARVESHSPSPASLVRRRISHLINDQPTRNAKNLEPRPEDFRAPPKRART
jgi:hypothetical protein